MDAGYALTQERDYQSALGKFQEALSLQPGDGYASTAIENIKRYIAR